MPDIENNKAINRVKIARTASFIGYILGILVLLPNVFLGLFLLVSSNQIMNKLDDMNLESMVSKPLILTEM